MAILLTALLAAASGAAARPPGGALAGQLPRVLVSTDIGGSDPDDYQSMVHLLLYADVLGIEGLISSPPGKGRAAHVFEVIDAYAKDWPALSRSSAGYPAPDALRALTRQGAIETAPEAGYSGSTEGSRRIVERARAADPAGRPLWVLVWGSITDLAQAIHDDPTIKPALRVHSIGSWNTAQDPAARQYLHREHPDLWWIESDTTFRGMYMGGMQTGDLGNREFVRQHVKGHGALGDLFAGKKADIKMGDTPTVLYLLRGVTDDPSAEHWGGSFVRPEPDRRPTYWHDDTRPDMADRRKPGARTVNRWRVDFLRDWQDRQKRSQQPGPGSR